METVEIGELRKYCVYLITNLVNGKVYVGQTGWGHLRRWTQHKNSALRGTDTALGRAIVKYGVESFSVALLEDQLTKEGANLSEKFWIAHYKANTPRFGYNMTDGGDSYLPTDEAITKVMESKGWKQDTICGEAYHRVELPTEQICKEYQEGKSTVWLGEKYGVGSQTILRRLKLAGIPSRKPCDWRKERRYFLTFPMEDLVREYSEGNSAADLSEKYECDTKTIIRRLQMAGVTTRTQSQGTSLAAPKMSANRRKSKDEIPDYLLVRLYLEGWSTLQLEKHFHRSYSTFTGRLKNLGVERRPRGIQHTRDRKFEDKSKRVAYIQQIRSEVEEIR